MAGGFLRHLMTTSTTVRIIHTSLFSFFYYLTIGLLIAVLPGFVHLHLGLSPLWAGVAVGSQYLATLVTRPKAGRMTDVSVGSDFSPRATDLHHWVGWLLIFTSATVLAYAKITPLFPVPLSWAGGVVETGYLNRTLAIMPLSS
jgi:hypothetical protein